MQNKDFMSYEYRTKAVKAKDQVKAIDMYEAFGWEITAASPTPAGNVSISMKRNRRQAHKSELGRLERQAEELYDSLNRLEQSKTLGASIFAYVFGIAATLIAGGGMSLVMLSQSAAAIAGGVLLGIAGIALCAVNYPVYKKIVTAKIEKLAPVIDDSEEKLAIALEKGNELLSNENI